MIEKYDSFSDLLARGNGFYDSVYPVIYCDDGLYVVDMNKAAHDSFGDKLKDKNFSKHLTEDDLRKVASMLKAKKSEMRSKGLYVGTGVVKLRGAKYSLVIVVDCFGERFAEIRLFRSRRVLLSSYDSRELMFPVAPLSVDYAFGQDAGSGEKASGELDRALLYNVFSHIYDMARSETEVPEIFDLQGTLSRVAAAVSGKFGSNGCKWSVTREGAKKFAFPVLSRKNFINLTAFAIYVVSKISNGGRASALVRQDEDKAQIEFSATLARSRVKTRGHILFRNIGSMYPEVGTAAKFVEFVCDLYGIGCYAEISKNFTFKLRFVLSAEGIADDSSVKHRKRFDTASLNEAIALIGLFEKIYESDEDPS